MILPSLYKLSVTMFIPDMRKEERVSPSNCPPAGMKPADVNVVPGNPIWLGGTGPEMGFVPGKRFMKKENKESPFAVSADWMG
jgi:hypothetical protein